MKYSDKNQPITCIMSQSTCYKATRPMEVKGVLWHSTGANNEYVRRYVQPDDNAANKAELLKILGTNKYKNDWNHISIQAGVNAFIGYLDDGTLATVRVMPDDYRPWGCGSGKYGSCNNGWHQFEICEDALTSADYCRAVFEEGCQWTAYICKKYNIDPFGTILFNGVKVPTILCHGDSTNLGVGGGHVDVNHWFPKFGLSMEAVRVRVGEILNMAKPGTFTENVTVPKVSELEVKAKDLVSVAKDATYWNSTSKVPSWVSGQNWYVESVGSNGRAVINKSEDGKAAIMSAIDKKYLTVVKTTAKASSATPKVQEVKEFVPYVVKITASTLNYRSGPGTNNKVNGVVYKDGAYTIIEEQKDSAGDLWGLLKSRAGWICLKYTTKI